MAGAGKEATHLETAHILFIDVVGYSKLLVNEQREVLQQLNEVERSAPRLAKAAQMLVAQKYVENVYYHELARAMRSCGCG